MMNVSVVTGFTPTPENRNGISGLIYAILKYRPKNVKIKIYTYNYNLLGKEEIRDLENDLDSKIIEIKEPRWVNWIPKVWLWRFSTYLLKLPFQCYMVRNALVNYLKRDEPDLIWVYPYFFYKLSERLPHNRFVVSGCDCEAFTRVRRFDSKICLMNNKVQLFNFIQLRKGLRFEKEWNKPNVKVHFVGFDDFLFYEKMYGYENAHFLLHPHYTIKDKQINFNNTKLKILIAGSYDIYTKEDVDRMLPNLIKNKNNILANFQITFLGKNWDLIKHTLDEKGFSCEYKTWVEDYAEELIKYDIQLSPISFGAGTKGKVLSALANGLLVIGSKFAFENICVRHDDSCIRYNKPEDIASVLLKIAKNKIFYGDVAEKGRVQVRKYHNPYRISNRFFEIYGKVDKTL